jgi:hypothetical protein
MDALSLLRRAQEAGLRVEPVGDKLMVRGPKNAEPMVKLLAEHKAEVLAALAKTAHEAEAPAPWFERVILPVEGEPSLELPCAGRCGRVHEVEGVFLHFCCECGAYGAFGVGVNLRAGRLGRWYCAEHRPASAGDLPLRRVHED